jgi:hypothetical protein
MNNYSDWQYSKADIFWGEIAPCDHVLQLYENSQVFLDALAGFVGNGINSGECCIVVATDTHLTALNNRLKSYGIYPESLQADNRYIPLNADDTLSKFMVNDWPDEKMFQETISGIIKRANNKRIRVFGEMVAILWAKGLSGATVHLEHLWNNFRAQQKFCLFCAYPKSGFTENITESIGHICDQHSKLIEGSQKQLTQIIYKDIIRSKAS